MNGILILDKPEGFTSFDAIAVLRRLCQTHRIGHTGTLDPMATGVLPILIGVAARAADLLPETDKSYCAHFQLGITTDTQDICGSVLKQTPCNISREQLETACKSFRGLILQTPPMYSALKRNGVPLYDLARRGIEVEREARPIFIADLTVNAYDETTGAGILSIKCSKGTYIRTLIADIGAALGCGGIMTALRRTFACGFSLSDAYSLEQIREFSVNGLLPLHIRPVESLFSSYAAITVTERQGIRFRNGGALDGARLPLSAPPADGTLLRIYSPTDSASSRFLGLGRYVASSNEVAVRKLFLVPEEN